MVCVSFYRECQSQVLPLYEHIQHFKNESVNSITADTMMVGVCSLVTLVWLNQTIQTMAECTEY